MKTTTKLWIGIGTLALLSPLGVFLPDRFKAGSAWGEWGAEEFGGLIGYIPKGLDKMASVWKAPLPDYAVNGLQRHPGIAYGISTIIGIGLCVGVVYILGLIVSRKSFQRKKDEHGEKSDRVS
jgi:cobalt/nickel transport protein